MKGRHVSSYAKCYQLLHTLWQCPTKPIVKAYRKIQAYRELKSPTTTFATTIDESSPPRAIPPRLTAPNRCTLHCG